MQSMQSYAVPLRDLPHSIFRPSTVLRVLRGLIRRFNTDYARTVPEWGTNVELAAGEFRSIDSATAEENDYSGPYNTLLSSLFPPAEGYQVAPQSPRVPGSSQHNVNLVVMRKKAPVFFLHVWSVLEVGLRQEAEGSMTAAFQHFVGNERTTPILGVIAFGTGFSIYEYNPLTGCTTLDTSGLDVLQSNGESKLREIAGEVKEVMSKLADYEDLVRQP
ncbi:hypothetical protein VNI00_003471 [Paramarasmius palmivorus]|uniref:Uncharacterized protein n=1 Tax=Paramarasmius palmivorus TaxID=297713 RepID=A0AAW0DSP0_9AGAR